MATLKKIATGVGKAVRKVLPKVLLGHEKAVAGFLAPIAAAQLARLVPGLHASPALVAQLLLAAITALTVHAATNTGA